MREKLIKANAYRKFFNVCLSNGAALIAEPSSVPSSIGGRRGATKKPMNKGKE